MATARHGRSAVAGNAAQRGVRGGEGRGGGILQMRASRREARDRPARLKEQPGPII